MIYVYLILFILFLIICNQIENYQFNLNNKKYKLGMLCIIKNEEMIIKEWIKHYIWQGVQHFYIIDNESTDGTKKY
jgi:hypothetical protein